MLTFIKNEDVESYLSTLPYSGDSSIEDMVLYKDSTYSILPRLCHVNHPDDRLSKLDMDESKFSKKIEVKATIDFRPAQVDIIKFLDEYYTKHGSLTGILEARTGIGKTVIGTWLISRLGYKTMILTNSINTLNQWKDALLRFTDLEESDINIHSSKSSSSKKYKRNLYTHKVTLMSVMSLSLMVKRSFQQTYNSITEAGVNFVICDEVDTAASTSNYSRALIAFATKNVFALTATPFNYGIAKLLVDNSIGKVIYKCNQYDYPPKVIIVNYRSGLHRNSELSMALMNMGVDNAQLNAIAIYNKVLTGSIPYASMMTHVIKVASELPGNLLTVSSTINQSEYLASIAGSVRPDLNVAAYYKSKLDDKDKDILCGVYKSCGRAYDNTTLRTLIIASPYIGRTSLVQLFGRVMRSGEQPYMYVLNDMDVPRISEITTVVDRLSTHYSLTDSDFVSMSVGV